MATYPSVGYISSIVPATAHSNDYSESGSVRSVDLNNASSYFITITHPLIDTTDRDTLLDFYAANKATENDITIDGVAYNIRFLRDYSIASSGVNWVTLETTFAAVEQ